MSKTLDLANAYSDLGDQLDILYLRLKQEGKFGAAQQIKNAENDLEQAALDLNAMDAIDKLTDPKDQQALEDLTDGMNAANDKISAQEQRITTIAQMCASLVSVVAHFKDGSVVAAVSAAGDALNAFENLTGWKPALP
jgi:hypothetical protein